MKNQITLKNPYFEKESFLNKCFKLSFFKKKCNLKNNFYFFKFFNLFKFFYFLRFYFTKKIKTHKNKLTICPIKNKNFLKIKNFKDGLFNLNYVSFSKYDEHNKKGQIIIFKKNIKLDFFNKCTYRNIYTLNNTYMYEFYSLTIFLIKFLKN